jgi:uncharacterized membrane protein
MATVGRMAPTRWPHRPLLLGLLAVSLALNLFFVGGAIWIRFSRPANPPGFEQRYEGIAAQLGLSSDQRAGFERYVQQMRVRGQRMRTEIAPLIAAAWDEIAQPKADVGHIMSRYDAASEKWREFQHASTTQTLDFLALLSPAQRSKFVAIIRRHHDGWGHPRPAK